MDEICLLYTSHRGLELLQVSLQRGLLSLVLRGLGGVHQNTLFGRLDIGQTKHLLRCNIMMFGHNNPVADMYSNIK